MVGQSCFKFETNCLGTVPLNTEPSPRCLTYDSRKSSEIGTRPRKVKDDKIRIISVEEISEGSDHAEKNGPVSPTKLIAAMQNHCDNEITKREGDPSFIGRNREVRRSVPRYQPHSSDQIPPNLDFDIGRHKSMRVKLAGLDSGYKQGNASLASKR